MDKTQYRVRWTSLNTDETHELIFDDIDDGYDKYQRYLRSADTYNVTWEHIQG